MYGNYFVRLFDPTIESIRYWLWIPLIGLAYAFGYYPLVLIENRIAE